MLIIGSVSTPEEAQEIQYIAKIVVLRNRIKDVVKGVHDE